MRWKRFRPFLEAYSANKGHNNNVESWGILADFEVSELIPSIEERTFF